MENLKSLSAQVPLCVLHAVLLSWLNGWTTSRRFQVVPPLACRFGHHCGGSDDLEHYAVCPELWGSFPHWADLKLDYVDQLTLSRFLLADGHDPRPPIKAAVAVFAVLGAFNLAKVREAKFSHLELRAVLTERIQMLRVRSRTIRRAFNR